MNGPCENNDRELWREREGDFYADSIHVTEGGGIGINCGGRVFVMTLRDWHDLASGAIIPAPVQPTPPVAPVASEHDDYERGWRDGVRFADESLTGKDIAPVASPDVQAFVEALTPDNFPPLREWTVAVARSFAVQAINAWQARAPVVSEPVAYEGPDGHLTTYRTPGYRALVYAPVADVFENIWGEPCSDPVYIPPPVDEEFIQEAMRLADDYLNAKLIGADALIPRAALEARLRGAGMARPPVQPTEPLPADVDAMWNRLIAAASCLPSDAVRVPSGYTLLLDAATMLRQLSAAHPVQPTEPFPDYTLWSNDIGEMGICSGWRPEMTNAEPLYSCPYPLPKERWKAHPPVQPTEPVAWRWRFGPRDMWEYEHGPTKPEDSDDGTPIEKQALCPCAHSPQQPTEPVDVTRDPYVLLTACLTFHKLPPELRKAIKECVDARAPVQPTDSKEM